MVMSKMLANRIKPFMKTLITPNQSDSVPDRSIHNSIMIAYEVFVRNKRIILLMKR